MTTASKHYLPEWIGVKELSSLIGMPTGTIYYKVSRNEIPFVKMGRSLKFNIAEVVEYFRNQTRAARSPCLPVFREVPGSELSSLTNRKAGQVNLTNKGDDHGDY